MLVHSVQTNLPQEQPWLALLVQESSRAQLAELMAQRETAAEQPPVRSVQTSSVGRSWFSGPLSVDCPAW